LKLCLSAQVEYLSLFLRPKILDINFKILVSGEVEYTNDIAEKPGELHAAYVLTKQSTGTITGYDTEAALVNTIFLTWNTC